VLLLGVYRRWRRPRVHRCLLGVVDMLTPNYNLRCSSLLYWCSQVLFFSLVLNRVSSLLHHKAVEYYTEAPKYIVLCPRFHQRGTGVLHQRGTGVLHQRGTGVLHQRGTGVLHQRCTAVLHQRGTGVLHQRGTGVLHQRGTGVLHHKLRCPTSLHCPELHNHSWGGQVFNSGCPSYYVGPKYFTDVLAYYNTTYAKPSYYIEAPNPKYYTDKAEYYTTTYSALVYFTKEPKYDSAPSYFETEAG
jgi:hypothetical protein